MNADEGKAGMVLFAGKTVLSMPERFEYTSLAKKALYKYSSFPFLSFLANLLRTAESENKSVLKIGQHSAKQWARA